MADKPALTQNRTAEAPRAEAPAAAPSRPVFKLDLRSSRPIVIKVKGKKKRKRKYSRGLKGPQRGLRKMSKAGNRLMDSISSGFRKYRRKADKSSRKKRDGMLKDVFKNSASGLGHSLRKSSKVPRLVAKSLSRRNFSRRYCIARRMMRAFRW